jgi:hypothetical protein
VVNPHIKKLEGTTTRGFAGTNLERKILEASLQGPIHHFMMAFLAIVVWSWGDVVFRHIKNKLLI